MLAKYDLVVIGGGSGGLAAAISAYDNGINNIVILEKEAYLGGILLQCIHNGFGLHTFKEELTGPEYASRFEEEVKKRNINYKLNTMVINLEKENDKLFVTYSNETEGLVKVETKSIVCATGCSERTRGAIGISGDRQSGVMTAGMAQKYLNIEGYMVGKKVFILGSGDIGLIMARRMVLEGAQVLGVAELMPYSNGLNRNIVQCLNDYNIPLYLHHTVKQVIGKKRLEKVIICEVDDNLKFIEGKEKEFECDTLLLSIGLLPNNPLLEDLGVKIHPRTRGPIVDESLQTSIKGIFACGNSLHVHDLVDFVTNEGALAGKNAAKYIKNELNTGNKINIVNGKGIIYVLPQSVDLNNIDKIKISFRVNSPYKDVKLNIYQGDTLIKQLPKPYLVPAEMENVLLDKSLVTSDEDIKVEVSCD
ncbi:MAG: NAD(P)/FAD-dependent oxidoreductase [Bacilli bacterium]|nr:NAD(P)/FAD-dependent oxidoreductase [Bacilli bacterium]